MSDWEINGWLALVWTLLNCGLLALSVRNGGRNLALLAQVKVILAESRRVNDETRRVIEEAQSERPDWLP